MVFVFVKDLLDFFILPKTERLSKVRESSLDLLVKEHTWILWIDVILYLALQLSIIIMIIVVMRWILSKRLLNLTEKEKIEREVEQLETTAPSFLTEPDTSAIIKPSEPDKPSEPSEQTESDTPDEKTLKS